MQVEGAARLHAIQSGLAMQRLQCVIAALAPNHCSALNKAATRRLGLIFAEMLRTPARGADSQDGADSGATLGS
jgi:hypothetical protein